MLMVDVVAPLLQTKVKPPTPPPPVAVAEPLEPPLQLTLVTVVAAVTGGDWITIVLAVAVQAFCVFVTNKLYVPGAFTTGVSVVAPDTILPLGVVHK